MRNKARGGRPTTLPWVLFLLFGIPFGLMAALIPLSMGGYYVEPLRRFWQPWPSDLVKPFLGAAIFVATLAFLAYRSGRIAGFHSGKVAAAVELRNLAEGRGTGVALVVGPPPPPVLEAAPPSPVLPPDPREEPRTEENPPFEPAPPPGAS
jgi:hypothetical protein